ncbi:LppX_LprAFG lipoprotein [Nonomuraea gerenzanensis]|uniref:Possible lipoprotein n=1 Tax=Nonomuraea gerenzanensis TaxID=93944 RepID=A0A1M4E7K1_9ACTN|nr:LppX_LprAFG lipoprotein [Nonomuraea gerenzanensis]UBU17053.1 LppX_LprAFG lipoprotein [Nonomuraea gerenzanensis]SBO94785.1 possible lipoprotein [Nonomuraea gerenzanensis]
MLRRLLVVAALALAAACSSGGGGAELPAGPELMNKASEAMKAVKSAGFAIATEGEPQVPIKKADGRLTAQGDADGTLTLDILGTLQEVSFALVGDTVHFKGPTGGFQKMTRAQLAQIYDPSVILQPTKGISQLLASATGPKVEGVEDGSYRVATTFPAAVVSPIVPGVTQDVNGKVWLDQASSRLTKASLPLQGGTVTVTFSDYDAPVTITPPATK